MARSSDSVTDSHCGAGGRRHDDPTQDVQDIYNAIPVAEKSLYWIEGTDPRLQLFGVHPELPIEWFDKHITDDNRFAKARSTSSPAAARLSACRNLGRTSPASTTSTVPDY